MKLFDKYQYRKLTPRGYTEYGIVTDEFGDKYWSKWMLGIREGGSVAAQISDELRKFQKAKHPCLPLIVDYGFDTVKSAYAVVYEDVANAESLTDSVYILSEQQFFDGVLSLIDCLSFLNQRFRLTHGDITPDNILIDANDAFYLIDFGIADMVSLLSQEKEIQIFAKGFASPEKFEPHKAGFPYQSDVYSIGKLIYWFLESRGLNTADYKEFFDQVLSTNPADRPTYPEFRLSVIRTFSNYLTKVIQIAFRKDTYQEQIVEALETGMIQFDVSPNPGDNILLNVFLGDGYKCTNVLWLIRDKKLLFDGIESIDEDDRKYKRNLKRLKGTIRFTYSSEYDNYDLTDIFSVWQSEKQQARRVRSRLQSVDDKLDFYKELLGKELEVIDQNSLKVRYEEISKKRGDLHVTLSKETLEQRQGLLKKYVQASSHFDSEPIEFVLSPSKYVERKNRNKRESFVGSRLKLDLDKRLLIVTDCEGLKFESAPLKNGWLVEDTSVKEEEKKRQLQAVNKVKKQDVLNPQLIYSLFHPEEIRSRPVDVNAVFDVQQVDTDGNTLNYSFNQRKAILTALEADPFSLIQGPPGTGKTTVITEIVFQILLKNPGAKVLITSQTNSAVDQVLENLLKNGIPICRLSGVSKPIEILQPHTLNEKLKGWKEEVKKRSKAHFQKNFNKSSQSRHLLSDMVEGICNSSKGWDKQKVELENAFTRFPNLKELHQLSNSRITALEDIDKKLGTNLAGTDEWTTLHQEWLTAVSSLDERSSVYDKLIDSIRVFGATCNHIGASRYRRYNFDFDYVIMDESGKATVAESLVPITLGKKLVLVGDHRQLKPMLTSNKQVQKWLKKKYLKESTDFDEYDDYEKPSLFEDVILSDIEYKTQLTECRRSSKDQVTLTSKCFYEAFGDEKIQYVKRSNKLEHNLPIDSSILFVDIGSEHKSKRDKNRSSYNLHSVKVVEEVLKLLNQYDRIKELDVGLITGYTAQMKHLESLVQKIHREIPNVYQDRRRKRKLIVSVFDRFQGLEKDVMIVDLVRSGPNATLGFMETPNRVNVALSRQKKLLIVVGDYNGLRAAKTRKVKGKAALQEYLDSLHPNWIIHKDELNSVFV